MMISEERINAIVESTKRVRLINRFTTNENYILCGTIGVDLKKEGDYLEWDVAIPPYYPLKAMGVEPISFVNASLLEYPHIMRQGNLCLHTPEYDDAEIQFTYDLQQLIEWVDTYYIGEKQDEHYDHLVVEENLINGEYYTFAFSDTESDFEDYDLGDVLYARLLIGTRQDKLVKNFVAQKFVSHKQIKRKEIECNMSSSYKRLESSYGVYCILNTPPVKHSKFIVEDYTELDLLLSQEQKDYLYQFKLKNKQQSFPFFCGYRLPDGSVHWQVMLLFKENLPLEPFHIDIGRQRIWHTRLVPGKIEWAKTENISYQHFFGRGAMPEELAACKFLIMGIGAIGSSVAETLTRCGARDITLYDIQDKEYGNVCRSKYYFFNGITEKTQELEAILCQISPHLECRSFKPGLDMALKSFAAANNNNENELFFNEYDIVFDCTTDNQLMRIIDHDAIKSTVINLSITNYAQDLVCVFSPRVTETVQLIYFLLNRRTEGDLYNPIGCWNPTFKASYNDISSKVLFAVKHIIMMLSKQEALHSFYLFEDETGIIIHRI